MSDRPTATDRRPGIAVCAGCDWEAENRGALGQAALHHDRTGHVVTVTLTSVVTYGDRDVMLEQAGQARLDDAGEAPAPTG